MVSGRIGNECLATGRFVGDDNVNTKPKMITPRASERVIFCAEKRLKRSLSDESVDANKSFSSLQAQQNNVICLAQDQIELGRLLGEGSFSSVYEIKSIRTSPLNDDNNENKISSDHCVVKVLQSKHLDDPAMFSACAADLAKEGLIMAAVRHQNILSVRGWARTGLEAYRSGRHDAFFLVLDKLHMTLSDRLELWRTKEIRIKFSMMHRRQKKAKLVNQRLQVALQLGEALEFLHSQNILHRDLKPENIGFDLDGVLKVFDFDVARKMPTSSSSISVSHDETFRLSKRVGSPRYMSPECALGKPYNLKADVYTFGLLLHELLTLVKPYDDIPAEDHDYLVFVEGARPMISDAWPKQIQSLLHRSWSPKISMRPTMVDVNSILRQNSSTDRWT